MSTRIWRTALIMKMQPWVVKMKTFSKLCNKPETSPCSSWRIRAVSQLHICWQSTVCVVRLQSCRQHPVSKAHYLSICPADCAEICSVNTTRWVFKPPPLSPPTEQPIRRLTGDTDRRSASRAAGEPRGQADAHTSVAAGFPCVMFWIFVDVDAAFTWVHLFRDKKRWQLTNTGDFRSSQLLIELLEMFHVSSAKVTEHQGRLKGFLQSFLLFAHQILEHWAEIYISDTSHEIGCNYV